MRVDNGAEEQGRLGARDSASPLQPSTGMDGDAHQGTQHSRPLERRRSSKNKAPPPPPVLHGPCVSQSLPAFPHAAMEQKENLLEQELQLTVVLPEGVEKITMVHGSKPMMDLLVMLCAKYHLNPSGHTIELVSSNKKHIKFKPNALIGALEAEKVLLKPKGMGDKNKKAGPQMPEATVRMVINYRKTQKTILRVNPRLPLQELLPAISEKCEFEPQSTVLLRSVHAEEPLDLSSSLNDLGIREVYARDTRVISPASIPPSPTHSDIIQPGKDKLQKEKENKGLFGMFKRGSKKKPEQASTVSAPASPVQRKPRPVSMSSLSMHSPSYDSNTMPSDMPKKRRAPLPPQMMSQSAQSDLNLQNNGAQPSNQSDGNQVTKPLIRGASSESSLKRSKRKAPPPPTSPSSPTSAPDEALQDRAVTGLQPALEEIQENEEVPMATEDVAPMSSSTESNSPMQELLEDDGSLNLSADVSLDSGTPQTASPSQDSEMESVVVPPGGSSEEAPCDLTTDGKPATDLEVNGEQPGTDAHLQPANNDAFHEQTEAATSTAESSMTTKEDSTAVPQGESAQSSTSSHTPASTHTQQAEPQAPPRPDPGQSEQHGAPAVASLNHTHAEIQTEMSCEDTEPSPSLPLDQPLSVPPPPVNSKRDMATSTDELCTPDVQPLDHDPESQSSTQTHATESRASAQTHITESQLSTQTHTAESQTSTQTHAPKPSLHTQSSECQTSIHIPPATKAGGLQYVTDSEPKPKPSNELTREYIPKVGLTTYTIVPQRSLDKLRFFEVEVTLESPTVPGAQEARGETDLPSGPSSPVPAPHQAPHSNAVMATSKCSSGSAGEVFRSVPQSPASPGPGGNSFTADQAGSEVKEKKAPPATRPKPASFRLPQHKRTPGSYVSSAAVRSMSLSDGGSSSTEPLGSPRRVSSPEDLQERLPSPPPPVQWDKEQEAAEVKHIAVSPPPLKQEEPESPVTVLSQKQPKASSSPLHPPLPRQMSLPSREPTAGLTLEKLRSFAAPKPYTPTTPSRFAQAVSSAVRRSQSLAHSPVEQLGPKMPLAFTKRSTIEESADLPESPTATDMDSGHGQKKGDQTPPAGCSEADHASYGGVEEPWKNGTTDLSPGCVVSPVTCPTLKSLPEAAQCQEE